MLGGLGIKGLSGIHWGSLEMVEFLFSNGRAYAKDSATKSLLCLWAQPLRGSIFFFFFLFFRLFLRSGIGSAADYAFDRDRDSACAIVGDIN